MAFDSFVDAMDEARSLNPLKVFRAQRNPLHVIFLFIYYLILAVTWIVCAIGLAILYPYVCVKSRIQARYFPPPKESANGKADLPPPLKPRKRRLTLPLPDEAQRKQATFLQHQSPFFLKLPAEVRRLVYLDIMVLPERAELCVSHADRRLYSFPAEERDEENPDLLGYPHSAWVALNCAGDVVSESIPRMENSRPRKGTEKSCKFRVLGLLTSCRRIYSEAIELLYQDTIFNVRSPNTMLSLQATTLPERFASIRHLHVEKVLGVPGWLEIDFTMQYLGDWEKACAAIGKIRDLRRLRVSFSRTHCEPSPSALVAYMSPLMTLEPAEFIVHFNWAAHATVDPIATNCPQKLPFVIVLHPGPPESESISEVADE
ncbi:hypothetical protein BJX63DRAFT_320849 [Aspergillus granulosus]|uniref:DUF7730 domain-containing protein n=1 Tax=Aspergillus granulosus TaxID=176169 RepID=A0ABR4H4D8_9EURO